MSLAQRPPRGKPIDVDARTLDNPPIGRNGRPLALPPRPGRYLPVPGTDRKTYYLEADPSVTTNRRRVDNARFAASNETRVEPNVLLRERGRGRPQTVVQFAKQFARELFGLERKPTRRPRPPGRPPLTPEERAAREAVRPQPEPFERLEERTEFGSVSQRDGNTFYGTGFDPSTEELQELFGRMLADGHTIWRAIFLQPDGTHGTSEWRDLDATFIPDDLEFLDTGYFAYNLTVPGQNYDDTSGNFYVGRINLLYLVGARM